MEMELEKFNKLVEKINKELSIYKDDEKGMMFYLNTVQLLTRVEPLELDEKQYEIALFEKKIDKLDYKEEFIERPTPKNVITKKDEDKFTIVNQKIKVKKIWNVANALNVKKSFTNKEEAMEFAEAINNDIRTYLV
jgi:hypothetical protein